MATASRSPLHMRSEDLIKKEPLDGGGFGDVYLCYHATLGQVVLKTVYTGCLRNELSKKSLLEEGNIMASLNHERIVKLLGVIMEDRDVSLVMELIPRGNLLVMLQEVSVPVSIKGRIILEILEGMVYLTEKRILHKDIKPENILVDGDFHIKIADLGLATYQTWSKLTREESRKKSRIGRSAGVRGAGTLSYMAPEHLESINTPSTEKSDVYSFAIVVWVILTREEPYANARSEDHLSQCVRKGDRPAENLIPEDTPAEMLELMKKCWAHDPDQRPTFKEGHKMFLPFYTENLEPHVQDDLVHLQESYEGPDELVRKMNSLSMTNDMFLVDNPAPLMSSDSFSVPIEASIEDLHHIQEGTPADAQLNSIQADASPLDEKLLRELHYHNYGSFHNGGKIDVNPFCLEQPVMQPEPSFVSSVQSWTKGELRQPTSSEEGYYRPASRLYESMNTSTPPHSVLTVSQSSPSLTQINQQHPHSYLDRQVSCPVPGYPVSDTYAPDVAPGRLLSTSKGGPTQEGSLFIQNASGIQIGNNNMMKIRSLDSFSDSFEPQSLTKAQIKEGIQKYADFPVTEQQMDILRENIGQGWKKCARRLGLTSVEIDTIDHDYHRDGLSELVFQMLEHWRMKEGTMRCTVGNLCQPLVGLIKVDLIQRILDTCSLSSSI